MDIWAMGMNAINSVLDVLSSTMGLGLAIVAATVLLRTLLLPLAGPIALRGCIRQKKLLKLQPQLLALKERYGSQPEVYTRKLKELYRARGISMLDLPSLLGSVAQVPLLMGMFRILGNVGGGVSFLWVPNLLRPDMILALVAGVTTAVMMAVNPDLHEQTRLFMIVIPSIIAIVAALKFSSALAIYWATSNAFSAAQTALLHLYVRRRLASGAITI